MEPVTFAAAKSTPRVALPTEVDVELVTTQETSPKVPAVRSTPTFSVTQTLSSFTSYLIAVKLNNPG